MKDGLHGLLLIDKEDDFWARTEELFDIAGEQFASYFRTYYLNEGKNALWTDTMKTEKPARGPSLPKQTPSTSTESNAEIGAVIAMLGVGTAMSTRSSTPVIVTMQRNRNAQRLASTPTWFIPLNSNVRLGIISP